MCIVAVRQAFRSEFFPDVPEAGRNRANPREAEQAFLVKYHFDSNPGLILAKGTRAFGDDHSAQKAVYSHLMQYGKSLGEASSPYLSALKMQIRASEATGGHRSLLVKSLYRVAVGLGADSVLENSLTLNRTYGTPLIPGPALKGLASHFCKSRLGGFRKGQIETCDSQEDRTRATCLPSPARWHDGSAKTAPEKDEVRQAIDRCHAHGIVDSEGYSAFDNLFGSQNFAGCVVFNDAWWIPERDKSPFLQDVMTVHHQEYYSADPSGGGEVSPPADYDKPNPIPFIDVGPGNVFWLTVEGSEFWRGLAATILLRALEAEGIGAKTSSGYGRLKELELGQLESLSSPVKDDLIRIVVLAHTESNKPEDFAAAVIPEPLVDPEEERRNQMATIRRQVLDELKKRYVETFGGKHPSELIQKLSLLPDDEKLFRAYAAEEVKKDPRTKDWKKNHQDWLAKATVWCRDFQSTMDDTVACRFEAESQPDKNEVDNG